jgi:hypothetical protein
MNSIENQIKFQLQSDYFADAVFLANLERVHCPVEPTNMSAQWGCDRPA